MRWDIKIYQCLACILLIPETQVSSVSVNKHLCFMTNNGKKKSIFMFYGNFEILSIQSYIPKFNTLRYFLWKMSVFQI